MKKIRPILTLISLCILSCKDKKTTEPSKPDSNKEKSVMSATEKENEKEDEGFIVLKNTYQQKDWITLYNEDHSEWKSFQLTDTFNDDDIIPYMIKPDYSLLIFKFLGKENGFYKVLVNENKNTIKYIKESDPQFLYRTVEEHILSVFSVDFNEKENPLRTAPDNKASSQPMDDDSFYYPVKITGDWLMVQDDHEKKFWIKWCDEKGHLILELYYDA